MKSYSDLKIFELLALNYLKRNETETKLGRMINRAFEIVRPVYIKIAVDENDIQRKFCYCENELIIREADGKYKFTRANEKLMMDEIRALRAAKMEIDFSACFVKEIHSGLIESEINAFKGIVISDAMADEMIVKLD